MYRLWISVFSGTNGRQYNTLVCGWAISDFSV